MEIPVTTILIILTVIQVYNSVIISELVDKVSKEKPKIEDAKVTDPFTKPKPIYSSTPHIVVPKTPTEIRNQNFKKIKEGVEYGDIRKD